VIDQRISWYQPPGRRIAERYPFSATGKWGKRGRPGAGQSVREIVRHHWLADLIMVAVTRNARLVENDQRVLREENVVGEHLTSRPPNIPILSPRADRRDAGDPNGVLNSVRQI
jgi:hypothetical protein